MNLNTEYSDKEKALFEKLNLSYLLERLYAPDLYRIAIYNAFVGSIQGPVAESLRRCANALQNSEPLRRTKEFDDLIVLD
jgi:hypothetical protein